MKKKTIHGQVKPVVSKSVFKTLSVQLNMTKKPPFGKPCNGCGYCCSSEVCKMGKAIYKTERVPCPGLMRLEDRFVCHLFEIVNEEQRPFLRFHMGIGIGCDSD